MSKEQTIQINTAVAIYDDKIDILKFILSLLVVAIHTGLFPQVLYPWLRIAVPLFFIISAYFFFSKLNGICDNSAREKIVKKFIFRNLSLYLFWLTCFFPFVIYYRKELIFSHGISGIIPMLIKMLLTGNTFTGAWYLVSTVIASWILAMVIPKISTKLLLALSIPIYVIITLTSSYSPLLANNGMVMSVLDAYRKIFGEPTLSFPVALVWMSWGKAFADGLLFRKKNQNVWLCIITAVLLYLEWRGVKILFGTYSNDCYFMLLPFCGGVFGLVLSMKGVSVPFAGDLRRCSTVIYVVHGVARTVLNHFFQQVLHLKDAPLLVFSAASLVSIFIYLLIKKLRAKKTSGIFCLLRYAY